LNPEISSNVVTYTAIVSAPNPELKLKPGMTANLTIEVARRDDVLRVPVAALRFRPTPEILQALDGRKATGLATAKYSAGSTLWQLVEGTLRPVTVTTGATDGSVTEISAGAVAEGAQVVTRATLPGDVAPAVRQTNSNPLMGQQPPRR
jgi:HlyD family secretion protein